MVRIRWRVSTFAAVAISLLLATPSQTFAGSAGAVRIDSHEFQGSSEIDKINRRIENLDKAIAIVEGVDLLIGLGVSVVPYGGVAYGAGKTIGFAALGQGQEALEAATWGVISIIGDSKNAFEAGKVAVEIGVFSYKAYRAMIIGQDIGEAFGQ